MIRSLCVWLVQFSVRQLNAWPWPRLLSGLGGGFILLGLQQQYFAQLGSSQPVTLAAALVVGLAWALAWGLRSRTADRPPFSLVQTLFLPGLLVALTVLMPWIWRLHETLFNEFLLASRTGVFVYSCIWAGLTLGCPVWCLGRLSLVGVNGRTSAGRDAPQHPSAAYVLGLAAGLSLALVVTWGSLMVTMIAGCAILLGACIGEFLAGRRVTAICSPTRAASATYDFSGSSTVLAVACGGLALWSAQVIELLLPATIFTLTAVASGVLLGIACGCRLNRSASAARSGFEFIAHGWTVLTLLALSAGFSMVVFRLVTLTGSVSQVWLLHSLRWLLVCGCLAPLGYVWVLAVSRLTGVGMSNAASGSAGASPSHANWGVGVLLAMLGGGITEGVLLPNCGLNLTCYIWLWTVVLAKLIELLRTHEFPRHTLLRGFAVGCVGVLIVAPVLSRGVQPELAARLLFATNVFLADQAGTPRSQLPFLDEGRLEFQAAGEHGIYTVWKSTISRHQIRENGIPRGTISTNVEVSPQDTAEVLLSLLPLTLHQAPRRVALLGLGSGVPLQTSLSSPVLEVTAVEGDTQLVSVVKRITQNTDAAAIWQDDRLTVSTADPALWVAVSGGQFDVVISNPAPSSLVQGSALHTREFYHRAARRLSPGGIFCQRFQFVDYGPRPLQSMAVTLRGAFRHVLAVELAAGEIVWLATNSEAGLIRGNLVERMQSAHVRELMAQVGWDWSVLLTLGAYDDAGLGKILAQSTAGSNTAGSGQFCTQLPGELMRWAPKSNEIYDSFTVHASKILNWVGEAGTEDNLLRRLSEVRGQQELVAQFPDQYWGYRSQVRKQISTRPLSRIEQAKHEDSPSVTAGLHPDDKRRLRYFQQLSKAIHGGQPEDIERLADFAVPYDPLISLFMHQELAEIAALHPELPSKLELTHRLHMVYFSPSFDPSVRNALSALRLVLKKPECVATAAERWDVINGLLQLLQTRWQNRGLSGSDNAGLVARDVAENIVLGELALEVLPKLAPEVGLSNDDWLNRRRIIERNLLGPLRGYRERLRPLAAKQRFDAQEAQQDGTLPSDEDLQFPGAESPEN